MNPIRATLVYVVLAGLFGVLSQFPIYPRMPEDQAMIRLTFTLYGDRMEACRQLTQEEIAKLPQNMKRKEICERARAPLYVQLFDGDQVLFDKEVPPSGFRDDGPSVLYESFPVPIGTHKLTVNFRHSRRAEGFDLSETVHVDLTSRQHLVIDFTDQYGLSIR
ncbi:MAG: hypothetical protein EP340_05070 [Alphaproteobacteria bacterium]|nr:MAG: hypothetical protein EP340_05070 [Alphaproteobacteria bacterium]